MWTRNLCSNGLQWWYTTYCNFIVFNEKYQPNVKTVILLLFILNRTLFLIVEKLLQKIKQNQLAHHVAYRFICYIKFLCTYYLWNQIYHIMRFWTLDEETFSYDGIKLNITLTINEYWIITKSYCSFELKEHYEFWFYQNIFLALKYYTMIIDPS